MRKFYTLLIREVRSYFYSPIAYVVLIFFLIISGIDFYFQISFMNQRQVQYTVQEAFFNSVFFWFAFVLIFPLITMRLFAEEFKLGTIEPLMTAPVRDWQVVLSKFFGALLFYLVLWIPSHRAVIGADSLADFGDGIAVQDRWLPKDRTREQVQGGDIIMALLAGQKRIDGTTARSPLAALEQA